MAASGQKRWRGKNRQVPWHRRVEDGLSLLRLAVDTTDPVQRLRVEATFSAAFSIRRAVQRDARARTRAYWAAPKERGRDPAAVRERVGLSLTALEHAAYAHLDRAPHLRRSLTKALAMHLADSVWSATERHLFRDARGERHGIPRIGGWFDFTRIPGRARSHTAEHKWETFRLHGSLAGHRAAYARSDGTRFQPDHVRPVAVPPDGWWSYTGPLAVVMTGLPIGTLVLPVRLPAAPANQPILDHHLADPARWHKIDLVRHRDPTAPGGWRYEAHLMVLITPYVAPAVQARRAQAALATAGRRAGIDVNVSNVTVASHTSGGDLQITRVEHDISARHAMATRDKRQRRLRSLDRSRRASNPDHYELSARQEAHQRRREAAGLGPVAMVPKGLRKQRANGTPQVAYRKDALSNTYRRERAAAACDAEAATQARRELARQVSARLVRDHGSRFVVEDCDLRIWSRRWGRGMAAFTPGTLVRALEREASVIALLAGTSDGGVVRASTRTTALSQHCLCGARALKMLGERTHACPACDLRGDRDAVSATLAACVVVADRALPASAELDRGLCRELLAAPGTRARLWATLPYATCGRQDVPSESTAHSARDGLFVAEKGPTPDLVVVARRIAGTASYPTLDERGGLRRTTSERARTRTGLYRHYVVNSTHSETALRTTDR